MQVEASAGQSNDPSEDASFDEIQLLADRRATQDAVTKITEQATHCLNLVKSLTSEVTENTLPTKDGLSFLEVKNHLLLQYLINLTGLIKLKTGGQSIQNSPFLDQLVELRTYLEKIRPIESKLRYQIDKLITTAVQGKSSSDDPLKFRANLDDLKQAGSGSDEEDSEQEFGSADISSAKSGVYRPPKVAPQRFDDEEEEAGVAPAKKAEKMRKKSLNQSLIRELQEEFLDTPVEIHNMGDAYAKRLSREVRDRERYEETYMTRLPVTKQDKHRSKAMSTIGILGDEITDFAGKRPSSSGSKGKKRKAGGKGKASKGKKFRKK